MSELFKNKNIPGDIWLPAWIWFAGLDDLRVRLHGQRREVGEEEPGVPV